MLNLATGSPFMENFEQDATLDGALGATPELVYESWATELGLPLTGVVAGSRLTDLYDGTSYRSIDLGFSPFKGVSQFLPISSYGVFSFYQEGADIDRLFANTQSNLNILGTDFRYVHFVTGINRPILQMVMRKSYSDRPNIQAGARFQRTADFAILHIPFKEIHVSFKFDRVNQSVDIYYSSTVAYLMAVCTVDSSVVHSGNSPGGDASTGTFDTRYLVAEAGVLKRMNAAKFVEYLLAGIVQDTDANKLVRTVSALDQTTKKLVKAVQSDVGGNFSMGVVGETEYMVIVEDEGVTPRNALIFDHVLPTVAV